MRPWRGLDMSGKATEPGKIYVTELLVTMLLLTKLLHLFSLGKTTAHERRTITLPHRHARFR